MYLDYIHIDRLRLDGYIHSYIKVKAKIHINIIRKR